MRLAKKFCAVRLNSYVAPGVMASEGTVRLRRPPAVAAATSAARASDTAGPGDPSSAAAVEAAQV